jgi:ABC-type branched-subunit amino acid transport system substrate-binding protein
VLAIVGSFSTVDNGGASALQGTNVPDAAVAGTPERAALANHVSHSQFPNKDTPLPEWKYVAGHGGTRAVLVYVSLASARGLMDTYQAGMARAGIQVVKRIELSPTQFSYDATARDIANSGADVMFFLHETNAASAMAQALANTPNSLKFPVYSSFSYGQKFTQLAGAAAEGAETLVPFVPFEEAASNPATQVFMKWLQRVAPGESPTFDALNGWTSAEFFLQSLEMVPGPITRAAVLKALQAVQDFNAGGAWAPSHPNDKGSGTCVVLLRVRAGKWTREAPGEGFIC